MRKITLFLLLLGLALAASPMQDRLEQTIKSGGEKFAKDLLTRDEGQAICSQYRDKLPADQVQGFLDKQRALIKYPADNKLIGDWKEGEKIFTAAARGNCYACHTADPKEAAAGNVGPSLTGYGARGNSDPIVKYTYEKIYNAWAYSPCSTMYRAGVHGILKPEEVANVVAFLIDPASPVNKK